MFVLIFYFESVHAGGGDDRHAARHVDDQEQAERGELRAEKLRF
jgi:hypothetical protein